MSTNRCGFCSAAHPEPNVEAWACCGERRAWNEKMAAYADADELNEAHHFGGVPRNRTERALADWDAAAHRADLREMGWL